MDRIARTALVRPWWADLVEPIWYRGRLRGILAKLRFIERAENVSTNLPAWILRSPQPKVSDVAV